MGKSIVDLAGKRFGKLTVVWRCENIGGRVAWHCICDCGAEKDIISHSLLQGKTKSCGCLTRKPRKDLTGIKFGRLTAIVASENGKWECLCDCGRSSNVVGADLIRGTTKSCGCLRKETTSEMRKLKIGSKNSSYTGGVIKITGGYIGILQIDGKYKPEHRIIAENAIGRELKQNEVVHHVNGIRDDNRTENLLICTTHYHAYLHMKIKKHNKNRGL